MLHSSTCHCILFKANRYYNLSLSETNLEVNNDYIIKWEESKGEWPLALDIVSSIGGDFPIYGCKNLTYNIPSINEGQYPWSVGVESPDNQYRLVLYDHYVRSVVGISDVFTISGETRNLIIDSPEPNSKVGGDQLLKIVGKARNMTFEGDFPIEVHYIKDGKKTHWKDYSSGMIMVDYLGNLDDFEILLDIKNIPSSSIMVEFYKANPSGEGIQEPVYSLPLKVTNTKN